MKKILGLFAGLAFGAMGFAQTGITFTDAGPGYDPGATTEFHFDFTGVTTESITEAATYYTDYFTVSSEASGEVHNVTVTLVEDNEMARKVIGRFLATATSFDTPINANGTPMQVKEFTDEYIVIATE